MQRFHDLNYINLCDILQLVLLFYCFRTILQVKKEAFITIIDSHAHVVLPFPRQLELMDEGGIDKTILFSTVIHPETATDLATFEKEMATLDDILAGRKNPLQERIKSIEELARAVSLHPSRYIGFGSIPQGLALQDCRTWIEQHILAHQFKGIGELAPGTGQIDGLEPVFAASVELGPLPLWVHTFFPLTFDDIQKLIGLSARYPSVPLILGHMGGVYWRQTLKLVKDLPQVYLDLSATFTTIAPALVARELPERTLFASDAPYTSPLAARELLERAIPDKAVRERVFGLNIADLLKL